MDRLEKNKPSDSIQCNHNNDDVDDGDYKGGDSNGSDGDYWS